MDIAGPARQDAKHEPGAFLGVFAWLLTVATFFLVVTGGQVTSTDSGDAVPTWPLPIQLPLEGGEFFELGHRHVAGTIGVLTLLFFLASVAKRRRLARGVFRATVAAAVLVILQAVLGGIRVLVAVELDGPEHLGVTAIGIGHALLGQSFFCLTLALAFFNGTALGKSCLGEKAARPVEVEARLHRAGLFAVAALFLQLFLGALLRLTRPGPVPELLLLHMLGAVLVIYVLIEFAVQLGRNREQLGNLLPLSWAASALLVGQLLLGFGAFFAVQDVESPAGPVFSWRTLVPTLHLGLGALLLADNVVLYSLLRVRTRTPARVEGVRALTGESIP